MTPASSFFGSGSLEQEPAFNLESALRKASEAGAQTLLILAGQPPVMRIAGQLSPPLAPAALDWNETRDLAEQLIPTEQRLEFESSGSAEFPFEVSYVRGNLTVFYGNGCHNLIFHLVSGNGKKN